MKANEFTFGEFVWWIGVVEDAKGDPEELGRVRVRIFGYHNDDKTALPTDSLMWATVMSPTTSASVSGLGTTPSGLKNGSHVVGFFMDGDNAQVPCVMGTIMGISQKSNPSKGFNDPDGENPKHPGEPDVNRLGRGNILDTIIAKQNSELEIEPPSPYNAKYPYNEVRETEGGIVEEFDSTPGNERYHLYHPSGTHVEIHPDGTVVSRNNNNHYHVVIKDEKVKIKGNLTVDVGGDAIINCGNSSFGMDRFGNVTHTVNGNMITKVKGSYSIEAEGTITKHSKTGISLASPIIYLN